jgi:hypothetical protein
MALNSKSHFRDSDPYAALKARYPDATHTSDFKWQWLLAMEHLNWPRPATFPTDAQFSLAKLFMPNRYDELFMPNGYNVRPVYASDELANHITNLVDWVDGITHQWSWHVDSPQTDTKLVSAGKQVTGVISRSSITQRFR